MPRACLLEVVDLGADAIVVMERRRHMPQQQVARDREAHATGQPVEERRPEVCFQLENLPVEGARRDVQSGGGLSDGADARHLTKVDEGGGVEHVRAMGPRAGHRATTGWSLSVV